MLNAGSSPTRALGDWWTAVTADGRSAHFEHTVAVTGSGPDTLTRP